MRVPPESRYGRKTVSRPGTPLPLPVGEVAERSETERANNGNVQSENAVAPAGR